MTGVLFRTGSGPLNTSLHPGSTKLSIPVRPESFCPKTICKRITRAISDPQSIARFGSISSGSQSFKVMLPELEEESFSPVVGDGSGRNRDGFGFGFGFGGSNDNSNDNDNYNERNKIGEYYKKMLKLNPNDPLLLGNYGKFLYEVEGDVVKAEEYYGRAILASPTDGELLSLYGKLIWDTQRDSERAQSYFNQAVIASPDDCMVMGSYAKFLWEADEEEDETKVAISVTQSMVGAF